MIHGPLKESLYTEGFLKFFRLSVNAAYPLKSPAKNMSSIRKAKATEPRS